MNYITGINRAQMEFSCLEEMVEQENQVRFLEAFVEKLDLKSQQFVVKELKVEGRPSFEPKVFL